MRERGAGKECLDAICVQAQPASARVARVLGKFPQTPLGAQVNWGLIRSLALFL